MLEVGNAHTLYYEEVGTPAGIPAVYLHGGPGSGSTPGARRNFDPETYHAVFDQRGCGRSRPLASDARADLKTNTTDHLVADLERLRGRLGIERWVVVGVSWGVTLALVYAERYPERVSGMVLGAVTSGRGRETEWITRDMGRVFPASGSVLPPSFLKLNAAATWRRPTPACSLTPTRGCTNARRSSGAAGKTFTSR